MSIAFRPKRHKRIYLLLLLISCVSMAVNLCSFRFIEWFASLHVDVKGGKYFHIDNNIVWMESNFKLSCSSVATPAPFDASPSHTHQMRCVPYEWSCSTQWQADRLWQVQNYIYNTKGSVIRFFFCAKLRSVAFESHMTHILLDFR